MKPPPGGWARPQYGRLATILEECIVRAVSARTVYKRSARILWVSVPLLAVIQAQLIFGVGRPYVLLAINTTLLVVSASAVVLQLTAQMRMAADRAFAAGMDTARAVMEGHPVEALLLPEQRTPQAGAVLRVVE